MSKHKEIEFTQVPVDYFKYEFRSGGRIIGYAIVRHGLMFMFQFTKAAYGAFIDDFILMNISEILTILNRKHGLITEIKGPEANITKPNDEDYEF